MGISFLKLDLIKSDGNHMIQHISRKYFPFISASISRFLQNINWHVVINTAPNLLNNLCQLIGSLHWSCIFLYSDNKEYSTASCCYQSIRCKWLCINLDHSSTKCFLIRPPLLFIKVTTGERSREGGNLTSPIVWNTHWTPNSGRNIQRKELWLAAHTHNFL